MFDSGHADSVIVGSSGWRVDPASVAGTGQVAWRKSSYSAHNGNCVEFAELAGGRCGIRDSKDAAGPMLAFSREEWGLFVGAALAGEFDVA